MGFRGMSFVAAWTLMETSVRWCGGFALGALLAWLALAPTTRAEDVTTLAGTTYRQVRVVRVEPDGVTWRHATGECKVDFTDLPEAVRKTFHFDATRAAAYRNAQEQARQQAAARAQQDRQEAAAWQAKHYAAPAAATAPGNEAPAGTFIYRRGPSAASKSVEETMDTKAAEQKMSTKDDGTVWDRRLWAVPTAILGRSVIDTSAHPIIDPNVYEYRSHLHHAPGGYPADSLHDNFYQGDYMTKAYYQDVERAEAFARGHP